MKISKEALLLIGVLVVVVLFIAGGCTLSCRNKKEGYNRACLAGDCFGLQRTPVDFAQKYPHGWQRNPHYRVNPGDEHQPLDFGPIDFHVDARRLDRNNGVLFQQYRNDWEGCGKPALSLNNDSKNRFDLTNVGDHGARVQLDSLYSPRFGPKGEICTEHSRSVVNPFFDKIYGGARFLRHDKLGD